MQQSNNNIRRINAQDILEARRIAESNATTNHFLGATPRPWMTNSVIIPRLPAERHVLRSNHNRVASNLSQPDVSGAAESAGTVDSQNQETGRTQPAENHATSPTIEILPASHSGDDAARKRPLDVSSLERGTQERSVSTQGQRPGLTYLFPSPEAEQATPVVPSPPLFPENDSRKIMVSAMLSLDSFQTRIGRLNRIERPRFSLLRGACIQNDAFYLCLHQIFCVAFTNPRRTIETGFDEAQYAGLNLLTMVLLSNQDLSLGVLRFFTDLPAPLERLIKESGAYRNIIGKVGVFLQRFAAGWNRLREDCLARKFPAFVEELVAAFEVHSPVLQKVLFNSIHRQLGGTDHATWSKEGLHLFLQSQVQHQARKEIHGDVAIGSKSAILAEQKLLGGKYKSLRESAINPAMQSAPEEHMVTAAQSRPPPLSIVPNQAASGPFVQYGEDIDNIQWSPVPNPLSRPQSVNTLRGSNPHASIATTGPLPTTQVPSLSSTMNSPAQMAQSSVARWQTLPPHVSSQGEQQPVPQRRRDRPPLSYGPVIPHIATSLAPGGRGVSWTPLSYPGYSGSHPSTPQSISRATLLIPTMGQEPIQTSNPDPVRLALHQAYLKSPVTEKLDTVGQPTADIRLYQYVSAFAILPTIVDSETALYSSEFFVNAAELSKKAVDITTSDGRTRRLVSDGSVLYRLRSVEVVCDVHAIEEAEWSVAETCWAPSCFVRINGFDIELRRKLHHGKDLSVDLTPHVREGTNTVTMAFLCSPDEQKPKHFAIAVEVLEVGDQTRVDSAPSMVPANDSLRSITQGLAVPRGKLTDNDEEIQVVDSHISIDLVDPFMATIFNIPARGKTCTHRECFDLQTFFQTRKSRFKSGPTSPDEWKCPICRKDARPRSLVVDCFLKTVRDSLVSSGAAAGAKAILIGSDGSWTVKRDVGDSTTRRGTREDSNGTVVESPATVKGTVTGNVSRSESVVIEIDGECERE